MGGRSYPVSHYPIAMRLRDRKGRAILCLRLSSKWELVGRCTRSAFRRTPSHKNTLICLVGVTLPATPAVLSRKGTIILQFSKAKVNCFLHTKKALRFKNFLIAVLCTHYSVLIT